MYGNICIVSEFIFIYFMLLIITPLFISIYKSELRNDSLFEKVNSSFHVLKYSHIKAAFSFFSYRTFKKITI